MNPKITVNLGPELAQKVEEWLQKTGKGFSEATREALQAAIEPQKQPSSGLIVPYDSPIFSRIGWWKEKFEVTDDLEALERATRRASIDPEAQIHSDITTSDEDMTRRLNDIPASQYLPGLRMHCDTCNYGPLSLVGLELHLKSKHNLGSATL